MRQVVSAHIFFKNIAIKKCAHSMFFYKRTKKSVILFGVSCLSFLPTTQVLAIPPIVVTAVREMITSSIGTSIYHFFFDGRAQPALPLRHTHAHITMGPINVNGNCAVNTIAGIESPQPQPLENAPAQNAWTFTEIPKMGYRFLTQIGITGFTRATLASYLLANGALFYIARSIKDEKRLMNWMPEKSLSELLAQPQEDMREKLLYEFTHRYSPTESISLISALNPFLNDIESEIALLDRYCTLANTIIACSEKQAHFAIATIGVMWNALPQFPLPLLQSFFAIDETILKTAEERRTRLQYIKTTLLEHLMNRDTKSIICF